MGGDPGAAAAAGGPGAPPGAPLPPLPPRGPAPPLLGARVLALLGMGAGAAAALGTAALHLPVYTGRGVFALCGLPVQNDFYAYCIGLLVLFCAGAVVKNTVRSVRAAAAAAAAAVPAALARAAARGAGLAAAWALLAAVWLGAAPLFLGTLFEVIVIAPLRVPADEVPNFAPFSNWALGLVFLKIWTRLCLLGAFGETEWKRRLERALRNGLRGVELRWTLTHLCLPLLNRLGEFLFVPYFLAEGVLPPALAALLRLLDAAGPHGTFRNVAPALRAAAAAAAAGRGRYCFPAYLVLRALVFAARQLARLLERLHRRLLDDRYLVGVELNNLVAAGEEEGARSPPAPAAAAAAPEEGEGGLVAAGEGGTAVGGAGARGGREGAAGPAALPAVGGQRGGGGGPRLPAGGEPLNAAA